jgi:hypothetical protein
MSRVDAFHPEWVECLTWNPPGACFRYAEIRTGASDISADALKKCEAGDSANGYAR